MERLSTSILAELIVLTFAFAQMTSAAEWFVATNGTGGGTNWADATNSIQGMIDDSRVVATDTVWVSNGVYEAGGVKNFPSGTILTNRVAIYKAITVQAFSTNPPDTVIKGAWDTNTPNGPAAVRCVYMTNGSTLIGFTLTNGATLSNQSANVNDRCGAGVWSANNTVIISNCVLAGNSGVKFGGGAYYGTLFNCVLSKNYAKYDTTGYGYGAGAYGANLFNCRLSGNVAQQQGGGVYNGILSNCTLTANSATVAGGGAIYATLYNCAIVNNSAVNYGGGAYGGILYNCTLSGNGAGSGSGAIYATLYNCRLTGNSRGGGSTGGGAYGGTLYNCTIVSNSAGTGGGANASILINCIVYFNTATITGSNWYGIVAFTKTCTAPEATNGVGNITSNPLFVDRGAANYRLNENSPAINAGANFGWMTVPANVHSKDLDGQRRIDGYSGRVDMGCYEYFFRGTIIRMK